MWFAIDTLDYLRKGGRIGAAQAWLGSALQIKPILTLGEEITPVERVRTRRRAFERMVEYARQRRDDGADRWVVQHIQDEDAAQRLVEQGREIFGNDPVFVSEVGPVIGAHVGPGLLGVGGVPGAVSSEPLELTPSGRPARLPPAPGAILTYSIKKLRKETEMRMTGSQIDQEVVGAVQQEIDRPPLRHPAAAVREHEVRAGAQARRRATADLALYRGCAGSAPPPDRTEPRHGHRKERETNLEASPQGASDPVRTCPAIALVRRPAALTASRRPCAGRLSATAGGRPTVDASSTASSRSRRSPDPGPSLADRGPGSRKAPRIRE